MTSKVQGFYRRVNEAVADLTSNDPSIRSCFVTSLDHPEHGVSAGAVCEATIPVAARLIANRTHRASTEAEVDKFHADQAERAKELAYLTAKNKTQSVMVVSAEQLNAYSGVAADAVAAVPLKAAAGRNKKETG